MGQGGSVSLSQVAGDRNYSGIRSWALGMQKKYGISSEFLSENSSSTSLAEMGNPQNPGHHHAFNLRRFGEDFTRQKTCGFCDGNIQGSAYCCEECTFFLHKHCAEGASVFLKYSCAELESKIQHPFHQQHPLTIVEDILRPCNACQKFGRSNFICEDCEDNICFCFCCIAATPGEDTNTRPVDDFTFDHFAHNHPLISWHIGVLDLINCKGCTKKISGDAYGCSVCDFFLHKDCARYLQEVKHPFHSEHPLTFSRISTDGNCNFCGVPYCRWMYSCDQCVFKLHFQCAVSTFEFLDDSALFREDLHPHPLKFFHVKWEKVFCRVCLQIIQGEVCGCADCLFFLHKSCAQLPPKIEHPLHEEHPLALVPESPNDSVSCSCCEKNIRSNRLTCQACEFALDVRCALETSTFHDQGGLVEIKLHFHDHPLQLCYRDTLVYWCRACEEGFKGLAYKCPLKKCNFWLHTSCAQLPSEIQHPGHAQHKLTQRFRESSWSCNACLRTHGDDVVSYCCAECDFHLDFSCASPNKTFKHPLHEHDLSRVVEFGEILPCKACGKSCRFDLYRCIRCDFIIHSDCLPQLPPKVTDKHFHPLTLADCFREDDYGEYICEFCGKDRNTELGVYYCEECPLESTVTVHMECAIPGIADKVRKILRGKHPEVARLDEEIKNVRARVDALNKELEALNKELVDLETRRQLVASL